MEALEAIYTRRSTRKFQNKMVPKELLNEVLEAGRYAPSGGNSQSTHFLVITKEEVLKELVKLVKEGFAKMEVVEKMIEFHSIQKKERVLLTQKIH